MNIYNKMPQTEEIFNKQVDEVVKKPKRKLTEKQLSNLALGREKMRLKREIAKKNKEQKQVLKDDKFEANLVKKTKDKVKKEHKEKRRTLKEINSEKEKAILTRLQKQADDKNIKKTARNDLFTTLKVKCLEQAKSVSEYNEIKSHLDNIDEETLHCDNKLKDYAKTVMKPYIKQTFKKSLDKNDTVKKAEGVVNVDNVNNE